MVASHAASAAIILETSHTPNQITLQNQYDAVRAQIDQLVADTGYRGTNLLNGDDLTTQFNERNTSKQTVSGVTFGPGLANQGIVELLKQWGTESSAVVTDEYENSASGDPIPNGPPIKMLDDPLYI